MTLCLLPFSAAFGSEEHLLAAEELYDAALYERAITAYRTVLSDPTLSTATHNQTTLRLAQSYYLTQNYSAVVETLKDNKPPPGHLLLLAMTYNEQHAYNQTIALLTTTPLPLNQPSRYQLALAHFKNEQFQESKGIFKTLTGPLPQLYLIRIAIAEHFPEEALQLANRLLNQLPADDPLRYEAAYLQAQSYFLIQDFSNAAHFFEEALPPHKPEKVLWYADTLYHLGWSYMKIADDQRLSTVMQQLHFDRAEEAFEKLLAFNKNELYSLALSQYYLARGYRLNEEQALKNAEKILSNDSTFTSKDAQTHVLLLRAQVARAYSDRDKFYRQLTQASNQDSSFYTKGWYLRGCNDFSEGEKLLIIQSIEESNKAFERAVVSFKKAFELSQVGDKEQAALALKYQAQALAQQVNKQSQLFALETLESMQNNALMGGILKDPDELYYLQALVASRLAKTVENEKFNKIAECSLQKGLEEFPKGKFADANQLLLGTLYYQQKRYSEAEQLFLTLSKDYPNSPLVSDALFWRANCIENQQGDLEQVRRLRQQVYTLYPDSQYAAEAYLFYYSYRDYLQGDRSAVKHLEAFASLFPDSPFLLNTLYLIGLDYKQDRKTPEGKWIRKKNLMAAVGAFQNVETKFDELSIAYDNRDYFATIRYRATLERALTNLAIAEESVAAKRQIYLEYAQDVFKQIVKAFDDPNDSLTTLLKNREPYPYIQEESSFWLAQTLIKAENDPAAKQVFLEMLDKYKAAKTTKGYFLSRVWYELGLIAKRDNDYEKALKQLISAEDAAKGKVLSGDQKLDLWIQQSLCYQALNQLDTAILILSKVVNDDTVSGLRLKAMFLRAEAYERQGRKELARKQLEATAKKGGEWAIEAKNKLEKYYGH